MKKSFCSLMALFMVLTISLSFVSCEKDSDSDDELIYGTWQSMYVLGNYDTSQWLYLPSNGKGEWSTGQGTRTFKYSLKNNKLKMTFDNGDKETYVVELLTTISLNIVKEGSPSKIYKFSKK